MRPGSFVLFCMVLVSIIGGCSRMELDAQRRVLEAKEAEMQSKIEELAILRAELNKSKDQAAQFENNHEQAMKNLLAAKLQIEKLNQEIKAARLRQDAAVKLLTEPDSGTPTKVVPEDEPASGPISETSDQAIEPDQHAGIEKSPG